MQSVSYDNIPPLFNDNILDPFQNIGPADLSLQHHKFEHLKNGCSYFTLPSGVGSYSHRDNSEHLMLHVNVRSILTNDKFEEFQTFLHSTDKHWSIICVSETWLDPFTEQYRQLAGYTAIFSSRQHRTGGGVCIYVCNECISSTSRLVLNNIEGVEMAFTECTTQFNKFIVGVVYRPPGTCPSKFIDEMAEILLQIGITSTSVVIAGDFNFDLLRFSQDSSVENFLNMFMSHGYLPCISRATRATHDSFSLLDNIFSNNLIDINRSGIIIDDLSDHFPVFVDFNFEKDKSSHVRQAATSFNYNKIPELQSYLQTQLADFIQVNDSEHACRLLIEAYSSGISRYSYTYIPSRKKTPIKPWITAGILSCINRKSTLFRIKCKNPTTYNVDKYKRYKNTLTSVIRNAKRIYYQNALRDCGPKETWKILNELTKGNSTGHHMPCTFKTDNGTVEDPLEIAESFNSFFVRVGNELKEKIPSSDIDPIEYLPNEVGNTLPSFDDTNEEEVEQIVLNTNNVGGGCDGINARIFKATFRAILRQLVHLMNLCIHQSVFPSSLKKAIIKPIFKAGDKQKFTNYRPISMLPFLSKILERLLYNRLVEFLSTNNILSDHQFGFRKGMSTFMPLLLVHEKVNEAFEAGKVVCGLYLDLRKAFDTVNMSILLKKTTCVWNS